MVTAKIKLCYNLYMSVLLMCWFSIQLKVRLCCQREITFLDFFPDETCPTDMFECNDGTCLPKSWECDGHPDCPDQSDETIGCCKSNV